MEEYVASFDPTASERARRMCHQLLAPQLASAEEDSQHEVHEDVEREQSDEKCAMVEYNGQRIQVSVRDGVIPATALRKIGLRSYDPGFVNTAVARSRITYIDGENSILLYRGYPIEVLAERSSFTEARNAAWIRLLVVA